MCSIQLRRWTSLVYLSIFIIQCFNVFAVKAKFSFPFGWNIIGNYYNFAGIVAGACLGMFIVYTPPLHVVFGGTDKLSPLYWLIPVAFGVLLLAWASIRVLLLRKSIENSKVKDIKGLMMCTSCLWFYCCCPSDLSDPSPNNAYHEHALKALARLPIFCVWAYDGGATPPPLTGLFVTCTRPTYPGLRPIITKIMTSYTKFRHGIMYRRRLCLLLGTCSGFSANGARRIHLY